MDNTTNTSTEGTQTGTEGTQQGRTFTQEDVNRIVQDRLAKERSKGNEELDKRAAELDRRERRMNAVDELRKNGLPDYLVDALNMENDDIFQKSIEAIKRMKGESAESTGTAAQGRVLKNEYLPGTVIKGRAGGGDLREAFGLR